MMDKRPKKMMGPFAFAAVVWLVLVILLCLLSVFRVVGAPTLQDFLVLSAFVAPLYFLRWWNLRQPRRGDGGGMRKFVALPFLFAAMIAAFGAAIAIVDPGAGRSGTQARAAVTISNRVVDFFFFGTATLAFIVIALLILFWNRSNGQAPHNDR